MVRSLRILGVIALILCLVALHANASAIDIPRKKLAGPPSEFKNHVLPRPIDAALLEDSAFLEIYLEQEESEDNSSGKKQFVYKTDLFVDSDEEFSFSVMSPLAENCNLELRDPNGQNVNLKEHAIQGHFPIGGASVPETTYRFEKPQHGTWKLKMVTKEEYTEDQFNALLPAGRQGTEPHGFLLLWNKSKTRLHSHLNTYNLRLGNKIGLITTVTEDETVPRGTRPNALTDAVVTADMDIFFPDGSEVEVQLHDDGLHGDFGANDGVYGGSIDATETGVYRASAVVTGTTSDGRAFVRSTQHLIEVVVDEIDLSGTATSSMKDKERLNIHLDVVPDQGTVEFDKLYRTYAEVWGKDVSGNDVAVCWIGGLAPVEQTDSQYFLTMELNLRWMALANAAGPLTLKNVILQETEGFVPISQFPEIAVSSPSVIHQYMSQLPFQVTEITQEMKRGLRTRPPRTNATGDSKLVLVHGYCSGDNPWQKTSNIFTNGIYFLDSSANRNNNEFAQMVYKFAESQASAWSMIGHSQGGMIGLHLLSFFESGLDDVKGGFRLQSVGTPYQGCSAAGSAASIGTAFGIGCGANDDLATDGAKLWLNTIPADIRKEAHYYTTTYEQGKFFGDYCNMAINAILEWPNDGTSEYDYAQLPGGVNMGNTEMQCHTTDMKYDPQYWDTNRNSIMNKNAAR